MFELESAKYFYLLVLIPLVAVIFLFNLYWKRKQQAAFADMELFLPGPANITRQIIERHFESKGLRLKIAVELDSLPTIHALVSAGLGATILSRSGMQSARIAPKLPAHPIKGLSINRYLSLCTPNVLAQSNAAKCVSQVIMHQIKTLVAAGEWSGATCLTDN